MRNNPLDHTYVASKILLYTISSAVLGVLAVPLPGLTQVILESLNPITIAYGTLGAFMLAFSTLLLPTAWCERVDVYGVVVYITGKVAVLASCLAGIFTGLAIGYGCLYRFWTTPVLSDVSLLSLVCAFIFSIFAGCLFTLNKPFFENFARLDAQKKSDIRLLALLSLFVGFFCLVLQG